ncbi:DUF6049 family protein, partial [Pseudonocardia acidicola]|nr:hypothetical protein [Pseudonocardia acidicola]
MRPIAALVAIAVLLLTGPLTGSALAAPADAPVTGSGTAVPGVTPDGGGPLQLDLTQLTPRLVNADGPNTITVEGTLTNTGTSPVDQLAIRLQRGDALRTEGDLRTALDGRAPTDTVTPQFIDLPGELAPGARMPVQFTVPLRGDANTGLALSHAGVYELLVNVNGVPQDGTRARLAAVRMLLPVLSLPPDPAAAAAAVPADTGRAPTPFTLLYPIVDTPRLLPTVPGEVPTLTDDDLAASFAPTGRLGGLVTALAQRAPVGSRLRDATCVAVDPELLETAAAMRGGYQVRAPDGTVTPGRGAEVAGQWLDSLAAVVRGGCLLALPYADADLVALTRGGLAPLAARAVVDGRALTAQLLGTPPLPSTLWPTDGLLDEPTLGAVGAGSPGASSTVVLSAEGIEQDRSSRTSGVVSVAAAPARQVGVLTDPLLTLAATGPAGPDTGSTGPSSAVPATSAPAGTSAPLSTQDTIGALVYRAETGPAAAGTGPMVLAPPHQWAADGVGADALLTAAGQLIDDGRLAPRGLGTIGAGAAGTDDNRLFYPLRAGAQEIPPAVIDTVRTTGDDIARLRASSENEPGVGATPAAVFDPMLRGTLRATSSAWRGQPQLAQQAADLTTGRITELRSSVRVLEPPSPYSLGTTDAPLLLTLANGLPVTMRVRVELASTAGLRVAPIPEQRVPPLGRIQVRVSAQVTRSGQFTVDATVRTRDGGPLGPPSRLQVRSTAYGTITVWLTATAGALLVVLAARRILRRARGEQGKPAVPRPGPPDPGPPGPTPAERAQPPTLAPLEP